MQQKYFVIAVDHHRDTCRPIALHTDVINLFR